MKCISQILMVLVIVIICGCDPDAVNKHIPRPRPVPITKIITEKLPVIEQRTTFDFLDSQSLRGRTITVYYLIAEDGSRVEVSLDVYTKVKIGSSFDSIDWR